MENYIAILKGINVGGKNIIKMNVLKIIFEELGFKNVKTYIQSGNIIFNTHNTEIYELENRVSATFQKVFSFEVPIMIFKNYDFQVIVKNNPFLLDNKKNLDFMHITFFKDQPANDTIEKIEQKKQNDECFHIGEKAVYIYCPNGYGKTKLHNGFLEKTLKVTCTTRNLKTAFKLINLAQTQS